MTRAQAVALIRDYCTFIGEHWCDRHKPQHEHFVKDFATLIYRLPADAPDDKVHRWCGWAQGMLEAKGVFSREQLRLHSKVGFATALHVESRLDLDP